MKDGITIDIWGNDDDACERIMRLIAPVLWSNGYHVDLRDSKYRETSMQHPDSDAPIALVKAQGSYSSENDE